MNTLGEPAFSGLQFQPLVALPQNTDLSSQWPDPFFSQLHLTNVQGPHPLGIYLSDCGKYLIKVLKREVFEHTRCIEKRVADLQDPLFMSVTHCQAYVGADYGALIYFYYNDLVEVPSERMPQALQAIHNLHSGLKRLSAPEWQASSQLFYQQLEQTLSSDHFWQQLSLGSDLIARLRASWPQWLQEFVYSVKAQFTHGDLNANNLLYLPALKRILFLDWEDLPYSFHDPLLDFVMYSQRRGFAFASERGREARTFLALRSLARLFASGSQNTSEKIKFEFLIQQSAQEVFL